MDPKVFSASELEHRPVLPKSNDASDIRFCSGVSKQAVDWLVALVKSFGMETEVHEIIQGYPVLLVIAKGRQERYLQAASC
jgi:hypothetical protein